MGESQHVPMWPVALITTVVMTAVGALLAHDLHPRDWLRRQWPGTSELRRCRPPGPIAPGR